MWHTQCVLCKVGYLCGSAAFFTLQPSQTLHGHIDYECDYDTPANMSLWHHWQGHHDKQTQWLGQTSESYHHATYSLEIKCHSLRFIKPCNVWLIVFTVINTPVLISALPHIELIELIFLNIPVFKASFYHVSLLRYWHLKFHKYEKFIKTKNKHISPQQKMIETWFKNWCAQLILRNLIFFQSE